MCGSTLLKNVMRFRTCTSKPFLTDPLFYIPRIYEFDSSEGTHLVIYSISSYDKGSKMFSDSLASVQYKLMD